MAMKGMGMAVGVFLLGVILLAVGAVIEPTSDVNRNVTGHAPTGPIPGVTVDNLGQALIAFGLTLVVAALGYSLAWGLQRGLERGMM